MDIEEGDPGGNDAGYDEQEERGCFGGIPETRYEQKEEPESVGKGEFYQEEAQGPDREIKIGHKEESSMVVSPMCGIDTMIEATVMLLEMRVTMRCAIGAARQGRVRSMLR
jgi:hypothetical protein